MGVGVRVRVRVRVIETGMRWGERNKIGTYALEDVALLRPLEWWEYQGQE